MFIYTKLITFIVILHAYSYKYIYTYSMMSYQMSILAIKSCILLGNHCNDPWHRVWYLFQAGHRLSCVPPPALINVNDCYSYVENGRKLRSKGCHKQKMRKWIHPDLEKILDMYFSEMLLILSFPNNVCKYRHICTVGMKTINVDKLMWLLLIILNIFVHKNVYAGIVRKYSIDITCPNIIIND